METQYSFKELYSVALKATYPMRINNVSIEEDEIIAYFDKIQIANLNEIRQRATATGGYDNRPFVSWDETTGVNLTFRQGIFSDRQLSFLINSHLISQKKEEPFPISERKEMETTEDGDIIFSDDIPITKIFIYDNNLNKIPYEKIDNKTYRINRPYETVIVDYTYTYNSKTIYFVIGRKLFEGYINLEGKTKVVDDLTGKVRTGVIKIPRLKITSDFSITLGEKTPPVVGQFSGTAYPIGKKAEKKVVDFFLLDSDLTSDIK